MLGWGYHNLNRSSLYELKVTSSWEKEEFVSPFEKDELCSFFNELRSLEELFSPEELFSLEELFSPLLCEKDTLLLLCLLPTPVLRMEALLPASLIFPGSEIHSSFLTPHPSRQYWTNLQNLPQLQWKLVNYHNQSVLCLRLQSTQPQCTFFVNAAELLKCFLDNITHCFPCTERHFFAKHIYVGPNKWKMLTNYNNSTDLCIFCTFLIRVACICFINHFLFRKCENIWFRKYLCGPGYLSGCVRCHWRKLVWSQLRVNRTGGEGWKGGGAEVEEVQMLTEYLKIRNDTKSKWEKDGTLTEIFSFPLFCSIERV